MVQSILQGNIKTLKNEIYHLKRELAKTNEFCLQSCSKLYHPKQEVNKWLYEISSCFL